MRIRRGAPRSGGDREQGQGVRKASPNESRNGDQYSTGGTGKTRKLNVFCSDYDVQAKKPARGLHPVFACVYFKNVAAQSAARFGDRKRQRRTSAHTHDDGAFFVPVHLRYGGVCGGDLRVCWLPLSASSPTPAQTATPLFGDSRGGSYIRQGTETMQHPLSTLLERRAASQRAMAYAALRADSSLSVRRNRYNHHIEKARAAEAALSRLTTPFTSLNQEHHHA
jgi:hypothetical protein